jgi:hypothetical protein
MSSYTLHLGFTWDSPQIASIWNPDDPLQQRFLQLALEDSSNAAAWFQFNTSDTMSFMLWDLGTGAQNTASSYTASLNLADPDSNTIYDPSSYLTYTSATYTSGTYYLALDTAAFTYTSATTPCWGTARGYSTLPAKVTFSAAAQLQLSLLVQITDHNDDTQQFLKTVELVVSS